MGRQDSQPRDEIPQPSQRHASVVLLSAPLVDQRRGPGKWIVRDQLPHERHPARNERQSPYSTPIQGAVCAPIDRDP